MQQKMKLIQSKIISQAIRDLASVKPKLREEALAFFFSPSFTLLSSDLNIDRQYVLLAIEQLVEYPIVARKKLTEEMVQGLKNLYKEKPIAKESKL
jgi:hypothetical protein|tara:strand:+ start:187 stop:474 length:288 start_codon:yes stop_codon:yes gene_type:complete